MSGTDLLKLKLASILTLTATLFMPALSVLAEDEATAALGPDEKVSEKADQLFEKGHKALDKRDLRGAENFYRKAISVNPSDSRYHRQLSLLLLTEGRGHDAEREALYATKLDPEDWKSRIVLGRIYHSENRIDEEVTLYKKMLAILPPEQKDLKAKIEDFIKKDEESVKREEERLKKKREWEEREFKNAY